MDLSRCFLGQKILLLSADFIKELYGSMTRLCLAFSISAQALLPWGLQLRVDRHTRSVCIQRIHRSILLMLQNEATVVYLSHIEVNGSIDFIVEKKCSVASRSLKKLTYINIRNTEESIKSFETLHTCSGIACYVYSQIYMVIFTYSGFWNQLVWFFWKPARPILRVCRRQVAP